MVEPPVDCVEDPGECGRHEVRNPHRSRNAGPREPDVRPACSCAAVMNSDAPCRAGSRTSRPAVARRVKEVLVGKEGVAALLEPPSACATRTGRRGRACRAWRPARGVGRRGLSGTILGVEQAWLRPCEQVVVAGPADAVAAPDHLALPEGQRDLAGDDHPRRRDALDQRPGERDRARGRSRR